MTSTRNVNYLKALDKVYQLAPGGMKLGLDRVEAAAEALGSPHKRVRVIQVAGTNGKGTVSALLENALRGCGLTTGLFTSPHLHRFTERIRLNGREIEENILEQYLDKVIALNYSGRGFDLTFFEVATLCALCAFDEAQVDFAILEVGLGGRLDATSIVEPIAGVITSIGLDHTAILGDSIEKIAAEKAAIARSEEPIFIGHLSSAALNVVEQIVREKGGRPFVLGRDFYSHQTIELPWPGKHQRDNAALAHAVFKYLECFDSRIDASTFANSISDIKWFGRFEILEKEPRYILDGAHNAQAAHALAQALLESGECPRVMLFGALDQKPFNEMYETLSAIVGETIVVPPPLDRAFDYRAFADFRGLDRADSVAEGLEAAKHRAGNGTVLVTGSFFTVAEARRLILNELTDPPVGL